MRQAPGSQLGAAQVSIFIETNDLLHAPPSFMSRTHLTHYNHQDLGWRPVWKSWLESRWDARTLGWLSRQGTG